MTAPGSVIAFRVFSFVSFILVSIPLPWHLQSQNSSTCLYILWTSLSNLTSFINSILWDGNIVNRSPVWCDVSSRLIFASFLAIPATCLRIQQHLYYVLHSDPFTLVADSAAHKRRKLMWDLLICLFFPILYLVFVYFVQQFRYYIVEDYGCEVGIASTIPALVLVPCFRMALGLVSGIYSCLNIYRIWTKRRDLESIFSTHGGISKNHYTRLFLLSGIDILITIPFNVAYFAMWFPFFPVGLSFPALHRHWTFQRIPLRNVTAGSYYLQFIWTLEGPQLMIVAYGLIFFGLFGVGAEARRRYASAWHHASMTFGWQIESSRKSSTGRRNLHISFAVNQHPASDKSDSLASSNEISEHIVASSTVSDVHSKSGRESFAVSGNLSQPSPVSIEAVSNSTHPISPDAFGSSIRRQSAIIGLKVCEDGGLEGTNELVLECHRVF